jgi:hypothetical protein
MLMTFKYDHWSLSMMTLKVLNDILRARKVNIDGFIDQARTLGRHDSEGVFTIAREHAIRKLASLQLPSPESWILKILQAAVSSGAERFVVEVDRQITYFAFSPTELFLVDDLISALTEPQKQHSTSLGHLSTGLRAVGFGDNRAFTLGLEQGHQCSLVGWNGQRLAHKQHEIEQPNLGPIVRIGIAHPDQEPGCRKLPSEVTKEMRTLRQSAEVCPISVMVDKRRVDDFSADLVDPGHGLGKRVVLSAGWQPWDKKLGLQPLALPQAVSSRTLGLGLGDRFTDDRIFHLEGRTDEQQVGCLAKISYGFHVDSHRSSLGKFRFHNKPRHSYVHWVKDGVVIDRHRWKFEPSAVAWDLYLSAEGLHMDISGLRIVRRPDVAHRIGRAFPWIEEQADATRRALLSHFPRPFMYHTTIAGFFTLLALCSPPAALFKIVAGGVAATHLGLSVYDKRQLMVDAVRKLERLTKSLHEKRPLKGASSRSV